MSEYWKKVSEHAICKYITDQEVTSGYSSPTITSIFNFQSRRIQVFTTNIKGNDVPVSENNFSDIESDAEIQEAFKELTEQGGSPEPYSREDKAKYNKSKLNLRNLRGSAKAS